MTVHGRYVLVTGEGATLYTDDRGLAERIAAASAAFGTPWRVVNTHPTSRPATVARRAEQLDRARTRRPTVLRGHRAVRDCADDN